MNFGLYKCESYEYVCSGKLQNIIMNTLRMIDVKHFIREKKVALIHLYLLLVPILCIEITCSSEKAKSIKKVGEKNLQKPITQTKSFSYPVILLFQPPMKKNSRFSWSFPVKSLISKWQ